VDLSTEADDTAQWAGEYDALAGRREKAAFISQLAMLGFDPGECRVTVRRVSSEGPADTRRNGVGAVHHRNSERAVDLMRMGSQLANQPSDE
jgi:hypothetical protein